MNTKIIPLISALAAASLSLPIAATPLSGSMYLKADAEMNNQVDPISTGSDNDSASWATTPANLSINASATATLDGTATVSGSASSTWAADGNSGSVVFTDYGWNVLDEGEAWTVKLNDHTGGNDWTYTFEADSNGLFTMTYLVAGSGELLGLSGWDILWSGAGGDLPLTNPNDPAASGTFQRSLLAGQTYTVSLRNDAFREGEDLQQEIIGSMDGQFDFRITGTQPVPEPATLALLGLGLAGLGFSRRKRA